MKVLFSVLRYQLMTDEFMNIGILFHNLSTDERKIETITKWKRVENFDDEVNVEMLKITIKGLQEEVNNNLLNVNVPFSIYEYPKKYVNELRFTNVFNMEVENFDKFVEITRKNFLRYDYDNKLRPTKNEQVKIMKELMKCSLVKYSSQQISGEHKEKVSYDYIIGKYGFKVFTFQNKKIVNSVASAKAWSYTALEMKGKIETVFLYDRDVDDKNFDSIISILKESGSKVIKIDDGMEYILEIFKQVQDESKNKLKLR